MNILMFLGGNYQKFTKETQRFSDLRKSAIAKPKRYSFSDYFLLNGFAKSKTAVTGEFFCISNNQLA